MDLKKAEKEFQNYLKNYDIENEKVKLKIKHTYKVIEKSEYLAKELKLDEENKELAKLIALLHDIGRFEQIKKTNGFIDSKAFDHANYATKILFKDNLIRKFIENTKYDKIIEKAIYNHNKYKVESNLNQIELLHCNIIRDADKLDNFRVKEEEALRNTLSSVYNPKTINLEDISPKVYEEFIECKLVNFKNRKTQIDYWICGISFIFDLNFDVSLKYIKENNYIDILVDKIEYKNSVTKQKMEDIRKCAKEYIDKRIALQNA